MREIIIATKNEGKVNDFRTLFSKNDINVYSLLDFPKMEDIIENGETFIENAKIKAEVISEKFNRVVIADDSGLVIDALNGRPGIFSARYAGAEKDDQANIAKVLEELQGVPPQERTAHFHCALALAMPGNPTRSVEGTCDGLITTKLIGANGFGYDPIFYIKSLDKTMAQLTQEEKNEISHRKRAIDKLEVILKELSLL